MGDRMCKQGRDSDSSSLGTWQPWGPCDTGLEAETPWERQILGVPEAAGQGQRGRQSSSGPGQSSPHVQRWRQASRHQVGVGADRVREQNPPPRVGQGTSRGLCVQKAGQGALGFLWSTFGRGGRCTGHDGTPRGCGAGRGAEGVPRTPWSSLGWEVEA